MKTWLNIHVHVRSLFDRNGFALHSVDIQGLEVEPIVAIYRNDDFSVRSRGFPRLYETCRDSTNI